MSVLCPICNGSSSHWRAVGQLPIYRCDNCAHCFHPVEDETSHTSNVYGDHYFKGSSEGYQDYVAEELIQRRSAAYYVDLVQHRCSQPGSVLDFGAACGFFGHQFQLSGWKCLGVEPNKRMREIAADRFQVNLFASLEALVESLESNQTVQGPFQLATMIQVISHLPNPRATLRTVNNILDNRGLLLIETWDRASWIARLCGKHWHEWNPPSVLHWFTRASLRKLIEDEGFEVIAQGLPKKRIQVGRAFHMLRHSWQGSTLANLLTAPLRLVPQQLAVPYLLGDAFWILARKR